MPGSNEEQHLTSQETPPGEGQQVAQTEQHVESAISDVVEAATTAPTEAIEDVLSSVKNVLQGVQAELKRSNDLAEKAAQPVAESTPAPAPEVEVTIPPPQERKIRRGARKVTRRG